VDVPHNGGGNLSILQLHFVQVLVAMVGSTLTRVAIQKEEVEQINQN
jgi:hypothetical protein